MDQHHDAEHSSGLLQELCDRERSLRKEIKDFEQRLQARASKISTDRTKLTYPKLDKCGHPETKNARRDCLYNEKRPFKNERIKCIGEYLGELCERDLLFYVHCVTQRHCDAKGETKGSLRYQALQLKMISAAHEELQERIRRMQV